MGESERGAKQRGGVGGFSSGAVDCVANDTQATETDLLNTCVPRNMGQIYVWRLVNGEVHLLRNFKALTWMYSC